MTDDVVSRLAAVEVLAPDGSTRTLGELWAQRPVVLVMIRHFG